MSSPALVVPKALREGEIATLALGFGLSTLAIVLRIYTKWRLTRTMKSEDYFSLLAWLSFLTYIGLAIVIGGNGGDPIHKAYLSQIESTIYCPIIVLVKISILLQYITIFVVHRGNLFHYAVHILLWTNVVFYTILTFLVIFECSPRSKSWDDSVPGHCFSVHQLGASSGVLNVISDFSIFILPMHLIWRLQMSWTKKWRIFAVFTVGLFGCVAAIMRLIYSIQLISFSDVTDPNQQLVTDKKGLWGFAEISLGIIAGCMPVLPRFFKQISANLSSGGSWSGFKGLGGGSDAGRTFRQRFFGTNRSPTYVVSSDRTEVSKESRDSNKRLHGGKKSGDFKGIATLNLTRNSKDMSGNDFPRKPSPAHDKAGIMAPQPSPSHIKAVLVPPIRDKELPGLPPGAQDISWQEMSRIEKADSAFDGRKHRLGR